LPGLRRIGVILAPVGGSTCKRRLKNILLAHLFQKNLLNPDFLDDPIIAMYCGAHSILSDVPVVPIVIGKMSFVL
jgi:hypothetical protein